MGPTLRTPTYQDGSSYRCLCLLNAIQVLLPLHVQPRSKRRTCGSSSNFRCGFALAAIEPQPVPLSAGPQARIPFNTTSECWLKNTGASREKSEPGPHKRRTRRDQRKRQVGGRCHKQGNLHRGLVLGARRRGDLSTHQILTFIQRTSLGSVMCSVQMVSTPHCSLNAASLQTARTAGMAGGRYISRTGEGLWSLQLPGASSRVNQRSRPLDDLPGHSSPPGPSAPTVSHTTPSPSAVALRGPQEVSLASRWLVWQLSGYTVAT